MLTVTILTGDCRTLLPTLPEQSVQCCITSPPYWSLRDYGHPDQIGLEATPLLYVETLRAVFREVRRTLRTDGTVFLNLGDSHSSAYYGMPRDDLNEEEIDEALQIMREHGGKAASQWAMREVLRQEIQGDASQANAGTSAGVLQEKQDGISSSDSGRIAEEQIQSPRLELQRRARALRLLSAREFNLSDIPSKARRLFRVTIKPKDLIGIPWRVAFALQEDGWYLRSDIIWHKPNPMPESVTDRPTRSHEYIFLLTKSARYYYDAAAIREPASPALIKQIEEGYNGHALKNYLAANVQDASATKSRIINIARKRIDKQRGHSRRHAGFNDKWDALTPTEQALLGSNKRDVWSVASANYREAHFATFPPDLIKPCILAGSKPGDTILDPFGGSGTTGQVALEYGRKAILIELNHEYSNLCSKRCQVTPGLALG